MPITFRRTLVGLRYYYVCGLMAWTVHLSSVSVCLSSVLDVVAP